MKLLLLLCCFALAHPFYAQYDFKKVQTKLDKSYAGMGLSLTRVNFGKRIQSQDSWFGFNLLTDGLEAKLDFGQVLLSEPDPFSGFGDELSDPVFANRISSGFHFYLGANLPLSGLAFGSQNSFWKVARFHPNFTIGMGSYNFRQNNNWEAKDGFHYIGLGFSGRVRLPLFSFEPFINWNFGIQTGDNFDAFRYHCINTGVILRLDGLKQLLNPSLVSVNTTNVAVSNIRSDSYTTTAYSTVNGSTVKTTTTHTTTSADFRVSTSKVGIQAIDPLLGITPKFSFNSIRTGNYIPRGWIAGLGVHARGGAGYFGLNAEFGNIGHGTRMENINKKRNKKVNRKITGAEGSFNSFMMYADLGYDISPLLLSLLGTTREDDRSITSFSSIIFGYSMGFYTVGNQTYASTTGEGYIDNYLNNNAHLERDYNTDPALSKGGYLGGFFLGVEVGVLEFRVQGFRFKRAPLANNRYFTLAYTIPIGRN